MLNNGLFRIGVPLFLIINGYFFYSVRTKDQFAKWLKRLFLLYLFWMVAYIPVWQPKPDALTLFNIFNGYFHLWYIANLLYAAICFWYLKRFNRQVQDAVIVLLFALGLAIQYVGNYILTDDTTFIGNLLDFTPLYRNFLFMCLPLFYLGYMINERKIAFSNLALAGALVLLLAEIWLNMRFAGRESFDILLSLVVFCPVVFVKVRDLDIPSGSRYVSLLSSSIFLTHPLIMYFLQQHLGLSKTPLTLLTIGGSLLLSLLVIPISRKLKFIL